MPVMKCPKGASDGGYAVSDFRRVDPRLGNINQLINLGQKLDKKVLSELIEVVDDFVSNSERAAIYRVLVPLVVGDDDLTIQLIMATKNLSDSYRLLREEVLEYIAKGEVVTDKNLSKSAVLNMLDIARSYDANTREMIAQRTFYQIESRHPVQGLHFCQVCDRCFYYYWN